MQGQTIFPERGHGADFRLYPIVNQSLGGGVIHGRPCNSFQFRSDKPSDRCGLRSFMILQEDVDHQ